MSDDEISKLNRKRGAIKAKITSFATFLTEIKCELASNVNVTENIEKLVIKLEKQESLWLEFETVQIEIEYRTPDDRIEEQYQIRETYYDDYTKGLAQAKVLLKTYDVGNKSSNESVVSGRVGGSSGSMTENPVRQIRLPTIDMPKFSGNFDGWLEFKDTFESLIHQNESISDMQKFHYLRAALQGDALKVIQVTDFTAANYKIAWQTICERYNNKNLLIHNHIKAIFEIEPIVKESARSIRNLIDTVFRHIKDLETLEVPVDHWDAILIYIIVAKLDKTSIREWEREKSGSQLVTIDALKLFLNNRADFLETFDFNHKTKDSSKGEQKRSSALLTTSYLQKRQKNCNYCHGDHYIKDCKEFANLSVSARSQKVKRLNLCFNCLCFGHRVEKCRSKPCNKCNKKHNSLLHTEKPVNSSSGTNESRNNSNDQRDQREADPQCLISSQNTNNMVLLSTVVVLVADMNGKYHKCRAVLDSGSMSNLITSKFVGKLQLPHYTTNISIVGVNQVDIPLKYTCNLKMKSKLSEFEREISCVVVPYKITYNIPVCNINISSWKIPDYINLADTEFNISGDIDMLIGAQLFWDLLKNESHKLGKGLPILQNTVLGWIVSGTVNEKMIKSYCNFLMMTNNELDKSLGRFFEIEDVDSNVSSLCNEDRICESHFTDNYSKADDGRFIVRIPLKIPREELGDSKQTAIKRFVSLEQKLSKDRELQKSYYDFMKEYIDLDHMEESQIADKPEIINFFLPHHGVLRPDSVSTKLRVVFDGSCKTTSGLSLNNIQYKGPACQTDISDILIRFREHKYVVCADIEKMYRQILVHKDDRPLQQIIWRFSPDDPLLAYTLKTVTYGTASAPFLAIRCLKQLGIDIQDSNPRASQIITNDFYVDDLITGFDDINDAIVMCNDVTEILKKAGFPLRKWSSNCSEILKHQEHVDLNSHLLFNNDVSVKTLGMLWDYNCDSISFCVKDLSTMEIVSKRTILSTISKLFDPLGLISPCIVLAKILIQKLWMQKIDWDESIPIDLEQQWLKFKDTLACLIKLKIPRHAVSNDSALIELHGFCDASCDAYAAAVYLRSVDQDSKVHVHLLCAKTKVAPLKQSLTVPKLELCGALLLAKLTNRVVKALTFNEIPCFMWCDSQVVLSWIKNEAKSLPRFETNRVNQIRVLTKVHMWNYVKSKSNPADIASRGILPNMIADCVTWWNGPEFLKSSNAEWPIPNIESKGVYLVTTDNDLFNKFSSFIKLKRVLAYCLRFCHNVKVSKSNRKFGHLTVDELLHSTKIIIKLCQNESFSAELKLLSKNKLLPKNNSLAALHPFLDNDGIIRVGGRLNRSDLRFDSKHPILLSGKHVLTKLIIEEEHNKLFHAGPQLLLANIRQTYWPTAGITAVKRVTKNCVICYKHKPELMKTIMADLPESRVKVSSPFYNTGVDYAGPFYVKDKKGRGARLSKVYLCIFVCFTTKAVHLELVSDLAAESFLATLRRFVARRGKPYCIYSDNATNFTRANKELKELYHFLVKSSDIIANMCANDDIHWKFIPPRAPHFGGIWEAAVKSCKYHLSRVINNTHLSYEEFYTVLIQVEAILNSRPLYALSSDPNDLCPLTPSHFLIGKPLTMVADPDVSNIKINKLSRWQMLQNINQHFWKAWTREYISTLQQRHKWRVPSKHEFTVNSLVLLKDDGLPPCKWLTGRIIQQHPGRDNVVRVVTVKTAHGTFQRPISKLCLLPLPTRDNEPLDD